MGRNSDQLRSWCYLRQEFSYADRLAVKSLSAGLFFAGKSAAFPIFPTHCPGGGIGRRSGLKSLKGRFCLN